MTFLRRTSVNNPGCSCDVYCSVNLQGASWAPPVVTAAVRRTPIIKPLLYLPERVTVEQPTPTQPRLPHARTLNSSKVTGSLESILSKTLQTCSVLMCLFFSDDAVRFADQGQFSRGQQRWGEKHNNTHARAHTHECARSELFARTPVRLKRRATQSVHSMFFFFSWLLIRHHEMTHYCFHFSLSLSFPLPCEFWSMPEEGWVVVGTGGPLEVVCERGAIKWQAGHHSAVKGILLMCRPSWEQTSAEYVYVLGHHGRNAAQ